MFSTLRDDLRKTIFGRRGGLTHADVVARNRREKMSDFLPYAFYDPTKQAYTCIDDTIGYVWECLPLYFADDTIIKQLQKLLQMGHDSDTTISFHLYADKHVKPILDSYLAGKSRNDSIAEKTVNEYVGFLNQGTAGLDSLFGIPIRNFRLFVSVKCKAGLKNRQEIEEILRGCRLSPMRLHGDELKEMLVRFFNSDENKDIKVSLDKSKPIRKQIIRSETHLKFPIESGRVKVGKKYGYCFTHFDVPETTNSLKENRLLGGYIGPDQDTNQIQSPFIYTTIITYQGVKQELSQKEDIMKGQEFVGKKAIELNRRMKEFSWVNNLPEGEKKVRIQQMLWVFDEDPEKLESSSAKVQHIASQESYEVQKETLLTPTLFVMSFPLGYYNIPGNAEVIDRYRILPTTSAAVIIPIQGDFAGTTRMIKGKIPDDQRVSTINVGRKGQLQAFDIFDKQARSYNLVIAASTGSGKSVNLNNIANDYHGMGAAVRIADIGYAYEKSCHINKGRFLDIGEEHLVFNPFYSQGRDKEDQSQDELTCVNIVSEMVYSASGASMTETQWTLLKEAIRKVNESGDIDLGIDRTQYYLRNLPECISDKKIANSDRFQTMASEMAFNLSDFSSKGVYGRFFNGRSNFNIADDSYVVLELQRLKEKKELFSVIVMQVMNTITQDLYLGDRTQQKFILFEEAAHYLRQIGHKDLSRLAYLIEEGYRRARKHQGCFGTVIQSILDLELFGEIGQVIRSNADWKLMLASDIYREASKKELIKQAGLGLDLLDSVKLVKPRYSEGFWDTPFGSGVSRLVLDPWNYQIATSEGSEVAAYKELVRQGVSREGAISRLSGVPL